MGDPGRGRGIRDDRESKMIVNSFGCQQRCTSSLPIVRHLSYTPLMPVDYLQLLLDLMEERQKWAGKRDEAVREISRLSELIRATMNMVPPEQLARYEPVFERIERRPPGLSLAIRACFTVEKSPFH